MSSPKQNSPRSSPLSSSWAVQGTSLSASNNATKQLTKLLLGEDLNIVVGLFSAAGHKQVDFIVHIIVKFFDAHDAVMDLIRNAIKREIWNTTAATTLFRLNNFASKSMACFTKIHNREFLSLLLIDTMNYLIAKPKEWSCELSPTKLQDESVIPQNASNLLHLCRVLLNNILEKAAEFPMAFKLICRCLKQEAKQKFPEEYPRTMYACVSGFIFLRYICPAIVCPFKFNIVEQDKITPKMQRSLLLASKVIQTLANGILFGQKEAYMMIINPFVEENQPRLLQFLEYLSAEEGEDIQPPKLIPAIMDRQISDNFARIKDSACAAEQSKEGQTELDKIVQSTLVDNPAPKIHATTPDDWLRAVVQHLQIHWDKIKQVMMSNNDASPNEGAPSNQESYIQMSVFLTQMGMMPLEAMLQVREGLEAAKSPAEKKKIQRKREKAEKRVKKLQQELAKKKDKRKSIGLKKNSR